MIRVNLILVLLIITIFGIIMIFYYEMDIPAKRAIFTYYYRRPPKDSLFNVTQLKWILNPIETCLKDTQTGNKHLLLLVLTARRNKVNRQAIRSTYGSIRTLHGISIHTVFILGQHDPTQKLSDTNILHEDEELLNESDQFGDLVLANFVDSYRNLTYKTIMGFKWATKFCPDAALVWKVDDDMFLDIFRLVKMVKTDLEMEAPPELYCILGHNGKPIRVPSKWRLTIDEYPDTYLPDFCYGPSYSIGMNVIHKLLDTYPKVKFIFLEDVYFTGIVMREAKQMHNKTFTPIMRVIWKNYSPSPNSYKKYCRKLEWDGSRTFKEIVVVDKSNINNDMNCLWNIVNLQNKNITVEENKTISLNYSITDNII